jgi:putative flippase GtrA
VIVTPRLQRSHSTRHQIALFVLFGSVAAVVNVLSRIVLSLEIPFEAAIVLAYACGMTTAYALNKAFVFAPSGRSIRDEYFRFTLVNLVAVIQVWIISVCLVRVFFPWIGFTWHAETVSHVIGVMVPVFTSYFGHKHVSFSPTSQRDLI